MFYDFNFRFGLPKKETVNILWSMPQKASDNKGKLGKVGVILRKR